MCNLSHLFIDGLLIAASFLLGYVAGTLLVYFNIA